MTKEDLESYLTRVRGWSKERQDKLALWIDAVEETDLGEYEPTDEERADLDAAEEEVRRGEIATDEEVKAFFNRYR